MDKVESIVSHIANNPVELKDIDKNQLNKIGKEVVHDELKHEMKTKVGLYRIKYDEEKARFISRFTFYTATAYNHGLEVMERYCSKIGLKSLLYLNVSQSDDFILSIKEKSANSIRLIVSSCSSFFTHLERHYSVIHNPFRGSRCRPKKKNVFALALPSEKEINTVIKSTKGDLSIALQILKECGVRVGILPSLTIRDGRYSGWSKGRQITGDMPEEIIDRMKKLKMNLNCPFKCWNDKKIKNQIQYRITRLCNKGIIQTRFSPHDLRHVKAINEYKKSHDIIKVKQLLNHASISMTDIYLRGLGVI